MTPYKGFEHALDRAAHLLTLYELLCDTRQRGARSDWSRKFKDVMHWPSQEKIVRIDGKDSHSVLVLRESTGIDRQHFAHDYVSEFLRFAVVAAISAIDRYMHDLVVKHSWKLLRRAENDIPRELKRLTIPVHDAKRAIDRLRTNSSARPGSVVKRAIQGQLHKTHTFQKPDALQKAAKMLGIADFWDKVTNEMTTSSNKSYVISRLTDICDRRNQIVHEADLEVKQKGGTVSLRPIDYAYAEDVVAFVMDLGRAIEKVVAQEV